VYGYLRSNPSRPLRGGFVVPKTMTTEHFLLEAFKAFAQYVIGPMGLIWLQSRLSSASKKRTSKRRNTR
jgi:hypothetical protein